MEIFYYRAFVGDFLNGVFVSDFFHNGVFVADFFHNGVFVADFNDVWYLGTF